MGSVANFHWQLFNFAFRFKLAQQFAFFFLFIDSPFQTHRSLSPPFSVLPFPTLCQIAISHLRFLPYFALQLSVSHSSPHCLITSINHRCDRCTRPFFPLIVFPVFCLYSLLLQHNSKLRSSSQRLSTCCLIKFCCQQILFPDKPILSAPQITA